jgi:hypothetical protein
MDILDNEKFQVIVDHEEKTITTRKKKDKENSQEDLNELGSFMDLHADSMFYLYDKIKVINETKDIIVYEMTFKSNEMIDKTTLTINKQLKYFESVVVKYKQTKKIDQLDGKYHPVTLKIDYEAFKPNSIKDRGEFSEKAYVSVAKNGKISASNKYSDYKVILPKSEL